MDEKIIQDFSEVIQSSNLNFLFGAGTSTPFLPLLGNIEENLNKATNSIEREVHYKEYLNKVILPNKKIINNTLSTDADYVETKTAYECFFKLLAKVLIRRKSSILSKQANLFTTNVDILMETCLEELRMEYNDGFSGKFNPIFGLSNFKKTIHQRSLHFDNISELPVLNVIKMHGSLTWKQTELKEKIIFSKTLDHFDFNTSSKTGIDFLNDYEKILIVNPEESKHLESVLNLYYSELLRLFSSELEKENASLFIIGFSMEDKHIKEITLRSAKSNPTLQIFVFCSNKSKEAMMIKLEINQHSNIRIFTPELDSEKYKLSYFNEHILEKITKEKLP